MTANNFQICLNNGQVVEISHELFDSFPKDSLLYNLLKEDQVMSTKNEHGQFLLTLEYPELFETVLKHFEKCTLMTQDIYNCTEQFFDSVIVDAMQALAVTFNYLGLPVPDELTGFEEESETNYLTDIAETITREAEKQIYDFSIKVSHRMAKQKDLFLQTYLDVSWARRNNETAIDVELACSLYVEKDVLRCIFAYFSDETPIVSLNLNSFREIMPHGGNFTRSPVYLLETQDRKTFREIINRVLVPVLTWMFCKNSKTLLESSCIEWGDYPHQPRSHKLIIKLKLKL
ncbi:hypothetical protein MP638_006744 [Amoeboaphelidium occidentale]|nr:hypothetical protein MP638_006744 [Amoeboaphelidium occidentale]